MSCKENFLMFEDDEFTPMPLQSLPDEMKEIMKETTDRQINFDILLNKFLNNLQITDIQLQQLSEYEKIILEHMKKRQIQKTKRPDECHKLFYKKGFKFAENQFFKKKKCKSRKMSYFYHHYFDKASTSQSIPITSFYHPDKKTRPGFQIGFKTFNITYIRLLLKSKAFRNTIKTYHQYFVDQCLKERQKKLNSFTNSIKRIMQRSNDDPKLLIQYLQSGQCKIPWTLDEIKEAQKLGFQQLMKSQENGADEPEEQSFQAKEGPEEMDDEDIKAGWIFESEGLFEKLLKE